MDSKVFSKIVSKVLVGPDDIKVVAAETAQEAKGVVGGVMTGSAKRKINIFASKAALAAIAGGLALMVPVMDRYLAKHPEHRDFADMSKGIVVIVGGLLWKYAEDDNIYTPEWMVGRNKRDIQ